jgi:hypothetical protein
MTRVRQWLTFNRDRLCESALRRPPQRHSFSEQIVTKISRRNIDPIPCFENGSAPFGMWSLAVLLRDAQHASTLAMIKLFKHKGLQRFCESGSTAESSAGPQETTSITTGCIEYCSADRGIGHPRVSISSAQRETAGSMVHFGERKLAHHVCVSGWQRSHSELRGLSLMDIHNPPRPGEFIRELYITPYDFSVPKVAQSLKVSPSTQNRLLNGESNVSPEMAHACRRP